MERPGTNAHENCQGFLAISVNIGKKSGAAPPHPLFDRFFCSTDSILVEVDLPLEIGKSLTLRRVFGAGCADEKIFV